MGEINVGKRLPLFQKGRNKLIQFFQRFRRLIDTASAGMLPFFIGIICILCPVKIKIMGAGSQFLTRVANIQIDDGFYHPGNEGPEGDGCGFLWR